MEVALVNLGWDSLTFVVCAGAMFYLFRLYYKFKGGAYGVSYGYYVAAGVVLTLGLALRVAFDLFGIDPSTFDVSFRDVAIMIALFLFAMGLRKSVRFWEQSLSKGFSESKS